MSLFQTPPSHPAEIEKAKPLDIGPDQVLEMDEATWYEQIYRGEDAPQLTLRAVLLGSVLGFFLAFTNLYIGLKTGWALGVAITASIISFAMWNFFMKIGVAKTPMTILETNCMQSTASSAGYATGGTMVSAIAALLMLSATPDNPGGTHLPWFVLVAWTLFLGILGTVIAIPMKRNLINQERLKFPSGTAAAVTLQSLYSSGSEAMRKAKALMLAGLAGAIVPVLIDFHLWPVKQEGKIVDGVQQWDGVPLLPADSAIFDWLPALGTHVNSAGETVRNKPSDWTIVWDHNPVMIAAGALVGMRIAVYMTFAGLMLAYVVGPFGAEQEWVNPATGKAILATTAPYKAWREIGLWLGVPIMVSSGLLSFAGQWRTIAKALSGVGKRGGGDVDARVLATEVPMSWFVVGGVLSGAGVVAVGATYFDIPVQYGILAVIMTFFLSLVAARATGESDITPIGAMGKLMQLSYGVLIPQSTTANLMTASITASAAGSAADLLNDLKSGYLLGANPRRQFLAQVAGVFSGTVATVWGFYLMVPDATTLLGDAEHTPKFPAPSAQAWKAVAEVFKNGIDSMHPVHQQMMVLGLVVGAVLVLLEMALPKARKWLPSATGIGLGLILPFQYPLSMLVGAIGAWLWQQAHAKSAEDYMVPMAAGLIAGISVMGVLGAIINELMPQIMTSVMAG